MKNILLIADAPAGGGGSTVEQRLTALESRVGAIESAGPREVKIAQPKIKSERQHKEEELADLQSDPDKRIALMTKHGVKEADAISHVRRRIALLKSELGIEEEEAAPVKGKKSANAAAKSAAALIIGLLILAFGSSASAQNVSPANPPPPADQQGYPQTYVYLTNFPSVITGVGTATSNLLTTPAQPTAYGLTNRIIIHRGAGLSVSWFFNGSAGFAGSNVATLFAPSTDGTNIDSWQRWQLLGQPFGATNVCATTNWNANQLAGYKALFVIGQSNLSQGTITNGGSLTTTNSPAGYTTNVAPITADIPQGGP